VQGRLLALNLDLKRHNQWWIKITPFGPTAQAMNVDISTIAKWVAQLKLERQSRPYAAPTQMTPDQLKIRELKKQIQRIEIEKKILKKATALLM